MQDSEQFVIEYKVTIKMFKIENEITKVSKYKTFKNKTKNQADCRKNQMRIYNCKPNCKKKNQKIHQMFKGQVKNRLDKAQKNVVGW